MNMHKNLMGQLPDFSRQKKP